MFSIKSIHTHLTCIHTSLQIPSTQHPGGDGVIIELVAGASIYDLH